MHASKSVEGRSQERIGTWREATSEIITKTRGRRCHQSQKEAQDPRSRKPKLAWVAVGPPGGGREHGSQPQGETRKYTAQSCGRPHPWWNSRWTQAARRLLHCGGLVELEVPYRGIMRRRPCRCCRRHEQVYQRGRQVLDQSIGHNIRSRERTAAVSH